MTNETFFNPSYMLTTQEAAAFLNVSEPYLVRLLDDGKIAHRNVRYGRRVLFADVIRHKEAQHAVSQDALQKLATQAQEIGLGY